MLELKNISFSVEDEANKKQKEILNHINLTVDKDSFVVITGPNGGGKSTLAKIIMGIEKPTSGQILYKGQDITGLDINERAKLGIGFAFQQPVRFKGVTVFDLINLAAGKEISLSDACQYLSEVGLCAKDYINREVNASLSGGEMKRIEIATVMARNTKLSVFDEPEAGIDLWSFAKLTETFQAIHQRREHTLIIISHQERIINLADEIVMIAGGEVVERGAKEEMFPKILENTQSGCAFVKGGAQA